MNVLLVLGNQLFDPSKLAELGIAVDELFLREDRELCTYFRFHKHKLVFFLAAMRSFTDEARSAGLRVHHEQLDDREPYEARLVAHLRRRGAKRLLHFEIEDRFFEARIHRALAEAGIERVELASPMFMTSRAEFASYLQEQPRPWMKTFYERARRRHGILLDGGRRPIGGRWSFDVENRRPLPKTLPLPATAPVAKNAHLAAVMRLVDAEFASHPGSTRDFWLPVDRAGAREWLARFIDERLALFGPYEDALSPRGDVLFHSVLAPFLNVGLLTPREVIDAALERAGDVPLPSLEGFVRQVLGWREFIRGVYRHFDDVQRTRNHFGHAQRLGPRWYSNGTGIPPLDAALSKVLRLAYCHHIERLMVLGNLMNLLEVAPSEAHRWFMEMFVDSSDWVMGPNVYGMALFSDGGVFATKPYLCGSAYLRRMGGYKRGPWCDEVDGLYWDFMRRNAALLEHNVRTRMMATAAKRIPEARMRTLRAAADRARARLL